MTERNLHVVPTSQQENKPEQSPSHARRIVAGVAFFATALSVPAFLIASKEDTIPADFIVSGTAPKSNAEFDAAVGMTCHTRNGEPILRANSALRTDRSQAAPRGRVVISFVDTDEASCKDALGNALGDDIAITAAAVAGHIQEDIDSLGPEVFGDGNYNLAERIEEAVDKAHNDGTLVYEADIASRG